MNYNKPAIILFFLTMVLGCKQSSILPQQKTDYAILIAPIDDQKILEGTSFQIHFAAIDDHLETLRFSAPNLPSFIKMVTRKNGRGYFEVNAVTGTPGKYEIELIADNNQEKGRLSFQLEVLPMPDNVLYLSPESKNFNAKGTINDPLPALTYFLMENKKNEKETFLYLMDGYHGHPDVLVNKYHIYAAANNKPVLSGIRFKTATNSSLTGVEIRQEGVANYQKGFSIIIDSLSNGVEISHCQIHTAQNTDNWTQEKWDASASSGIIVYGKSCTITNNLFESTFHALQTDADDNIIAYNIIDRFAGDAIRNTGDNNSYRYNLIKNAVVDDYGDPDGNHDDCFQSWTFTAPIRNIILENNIAISCLEPDLPLKSSVVQGIACFDGFEENWIIRNNLVVLDHPHGIALFGAKNCMVKQNVILRNPYHFFSFESDPWIMINNHKDGRPSQHNIVTNNLCGVLKIKDSLAIMQNNITIDGQYDHYLKNYQGWDFRKK